MNLIIRTDGREYTYTAKELREIARCNASGRGRAFLGYDIRYNEDVGRMVMLVHGRIRGGERFIETDTITL